MWNNGNIYRVISEKIQGRNGKELLDSLDLAYEESVLDFGCGTGAFLEALSERIRQGTLYAFDISDSMLSEARKLVESKGLGRVVFLPVRKPGSGIPLPDDSVGLVFSNAVLHWVPDKRGTFAEFRRVLKAGGRIAMHVASRHRAVHLDELESIARTAFTNHGIDSLFPEGELLSTKRMDLDMVAGIGEEHGFTVVDAQNVNRIQRFEGDEFIDFCTSSGDMYFHRCPEGIRSRVIEEVKEAASRRMGNELVHSSLLVHLRKRPW